MTKLPPSNSRTRGPSGHRERRSRAFGGVLLVGLTIALVHCGATTSVDSRTNHDVGNPDDPTDPAYDPSQNVNLPTTKPIEVRCGDGRCDPVGGHLGGESCASCPSDCGKCEATCGDGICNYIAGETCGTCAADCGACATSCGDGQCNGHESCDTCPKDCGLCAPSCGDHICQDKKYQPQGEAGAGNTDTGAAGAGNESAAALEDCRRCPQDCGRCPPGCGDGECGVGENCGTCPEDCGACLKNCGDGKCDLSEGETCLSCSDCGTCGNATGGNSGYAGPGGGGFMSGGQSSGNGSGNDGFASKPGCASGVCVTDHAVGDGICDFTAGETCANAPADCGKGAGCTPGSGLENPFHVAEALIADALSKANGGSALGIHADEWGCLMAICDNRCNWGVPQLLIADSRCANKVTFGKK